MPALVFGLTGRCCLVQFVFRRLRRAIFWSEYDLALLADDFAFRITENSLRAEIPADHPAFRIEHENRVILHSLNQKPEPFFALTQGFFALFPLGNIPE